MLLASSVDTLPFTTAGSILFAFPPARPVWIEPQEVRTKEIRAPIGHNKFTWFLPMANPHPAFGTSSWLKLVEKGIWKRHNTDTGSSALWYKYRCTLVQVHTGAGQQERGSEEQQFSMYVQSSTTTRVFTQQAS